MENFSKEKTNTNDMLGNGYCRLKQINNKLYYADYKGRKIFWEESYKSPMNEISFESSPDEVKLAFVNNFLKQEKEDLVEVNMCLYFMENSYKNLIAQFNKNYLSLVQGTSEEIGFNNMKTSVLIENSFIQFSESRKRFPADGTFRGVLENFLSKISKDFNRFKQGCPSFDTTLLQNLEKYKSVVEGRPIIFESRREVENVDPLNLLKAFEHIQKSLHQSDLVREGFAQKEDIKICEFNSGWIFPAGNLL